MASELNLDLTNPAPATPLASDITNVDLRLLRKVRGIVPLGRYAARDDGSVVVAVPDTMEVRTLHVARYESGGGSSIQETYGVETLRKVDLAPGGGGIGMTDDDLYLFRASRKSRFLPERRTSYTDIALSESGERFVAAYSDMIQSGHAIVWGDIGGRALWTKEVGFPISRVAINRSATYLVVGGETGDLIVLDSARETVLRFRGETPIRAVATLGRERTVFAAERGVGAVDANGRLLWFHETTPDTIGIPFEIAIDNHARTTAVLLRRDENAGTLLFLNRDGLPVWDIEFEDSRPTGLALAPDGTFAAITLRDGSLSTYELTYGRRVLGAGGAATLDAARAARADGDLHAALRLLRDRLATAPADLHAADALVATLEELRARSLAVTETARTVGDWAAADGALKAYLGESPVDAEMVALRADLRGQWADAARTAAQTAISGGDGTTAEARLLEALSADPRDREARVLLAGALHAAVAQRVATARQAMTAGDFGAAITALIDAQTRDTDSPEIVGLLRAARIGQALAMGNTLYGDRQYAAAVFQFKKVLRMDPTNSDALQKVSYCQNFLQDTQLSDRFTRLE